ncbi:Vacuolar protein sorting-associated protein 2 like 2 [Apostasia shenzhenica]|uniref:Vacuolar protein sorting-associated protein 2 like 2 n=1 Tax=Apostasia shenzhenica TaxID=1088818 RepID=A0A2I0B2F4_9ASPA|nr:Vacuolar protein sorting-associated protein 2 like 2 [Apostasia shenzhenica]
MAQVVLSQNLETLSSLLGLRKKLTAKALSRGTGIVEGGGGHEHPQEEAHSQRTSKKELSVATRGIEREIGSLQLEEKKLVAEIKKTAKTGNEAATKILARQLIRLRQQITNLQGSRAQIRGVATHTQAMYASTSVSTGMKGASKAMAAMNKEMAPAKQAKIMKEFQKQSTQMDMTLEMMSEAIDDTLDKDEEEEETEELTNQVLDEIGVDIASQLSSAPKGRIAVNNAQRYLCILNLDYAPLKQVKSILDE